jgi:hypothetical protein
MTDESFRTLSKVGAIVRTILAADPTYGSVLATGWSEWDTSRRFARIESTVQHLEFRLSAFCDKFGALTIGDEEFQLLEEILRRVQIEHRERKRQRFAQLLVGTWTSQRHRSFEERMRHIRALEEFSDLHIEILQFLDTQTKAGMYPSYVAIGDAVDIPTEDRDAQLVPALDRLVSGYGFIKRAWGMSTGEGTLLLSGNLSVEGIARKCEHTITEAGRRFLDAISD